VKRLTICNEIKSRLNTILVGFSSD